MRQTVSSSSAGVSWQWSGHNKKGRIVGTGTYLFRAVSTARVRDGQGKVLETFRDDSRRPIGVIRR